MKFIASAILFALAASPAAVTATNTKGVRGREDQKRRVLTQQEGCILTIEETHLPEETVVPVRNDAVGSRRMTQSKADGYKEWVCELTGVDAENAEDKLVHLNGIDDSFFEDNGVESGETMIYVPDATIEGHEMTIPAGSTDITLEKKESSTSSSKSSKSAKSEGDRKRQRRLASGISSTDTTTQSKTLNKQRKVLVVRVSGKTSASASQLASDIFTDSVSLATQYNRCSYGKLDIVPAQGSNIAGGVVTVNLSGKSFSGAESSTVRTWMTDAAESLIGVNSLSSAYDHVMFCQPPGTVKSGNGWYAYAGINSWYSVFNDDACSSVSAQMHELGHNFYLAHSNEGSNAYDDKTGMMGISYGEDDTSMCFNPGKSWQLGWYQDKNVFLDPQTTPAFRAEMVGVEHYQQYSASDTVVIKIEDGSTSYYVGYNRQDGMNGQTKEAGNRVTVVKKTTIGYQTTNLVAKLSSGSSYTISNFRGSGENVNIKFVSTSQGINKAIVDVIYSGQQVTPFPTAAPSPPCQAGESFFELFIKCDYWCPDDNSFTLKHKNSGALVKSGGNWGNYAEEYVSVCINSDTDYEFVFKDVYGDGMPTGNGNPNGYVKALIDGVVEFEGWGEEGFKEKVMNFKTPASAGGPTGPSPTPNPTPAPTPNPTAAPTPNPTPNPTPAPTPNPTPNPTPGATPAPTPNPTPAPTPNPTPNPTPGATPAPTPAPTPNPTPAPNPGLANGKKKLKIDVQLDYWAPDDNSWTLIEDSSGNMVASGGSYGRNAFDTREVDLTEGESYTFKFIDAWGDGICCSHGEGYFRGELEGTEIFSGGEGIGKEVVEQINVPVTQADPTPAPTNPPQGPAPTPNPTPAPTPNPTDAPGACPSGQVEFELYFKLDHYAEDSTWQLEEVGQSGTIEASDGNYAGKPNHEETKTWCLDTGKTYTWTLFDAWGDSICCSYGNGSFTGKVDGNQVFSGGEGFGKESANTFST
ncbi:MAG: hypothetical protein SGILL_003513 [Bacillariaceae sp.]